MTKKCFCCAKKNWKKEHIPFCSVKCQDKFAESLSRKNRLVECEKMLSEQNTTDKDRASANKINEFTYTGKQAHATKSLRNSKSKTNASSVKNSPRTLEGGLK